MCLRFGEIAFGGLQESELFDEGFLEDKLSGLECLVPDEVDDPFLA